MEEELKIKMYSFTLDCMEPQVLAKVYASMLKWEVMLINDVWATVYAPGTNQGTYPCILFQRNPEYISPVWPEQPGAQQQMAHMDFAVNDLLKAQLVGKAIAKLHKAFSEMTNQSEFYDNNFVDELNGWIKESLAKFAVGSFAYSIFDECVQELDLVYDKLVRHLIHRDMHLGNLLFGENKITGYIDFDLTQINARIFDTAYFLVGWLVGEIDNHRFTDMWKKTVTIIIEEYDKELGLNEQEINSLGIMMCCIELLFVAYFYQIDDVENALKAEECLCWLWDNF